MKRSLFLSLLFSFLSIPAAPLFAQLQPANTDAAADPQQVAAIGAVLAQVQDGLANIQRDLKGKHLPQLKTVTVTLNTVLQKEAGGALKLWVVTIGGEHEKDKTQEVAITLTPPPPAKPLVAAVPNFSSALESAVVSAAEAAQSTGSGAVPLRFSGLTATLSFVVKNSGNAGVKILILPITVDLSGKVSSSQTQTLKVVFDDSPAPKK